MWGYGTSDPLEEVLAPDYFALARTLLRPGELIYVNVRPRQRRGSEAEAGEPRMTLVMTRAAEGDAQATGGSVRLVQGLRARQATWRRRLRRRQRGQARPRPHEPKRPDPSRSSRPPNSYTTSRDTTVRNSAPNQNCAS